MSYVFIKRENTMGRKPRDKSEEDTAAKIDLKAFLKGSKIKGLELASTLESSKMSNITEWVSTGSYSLNKLVSGDIYKGLPRGRIMALAGPSGVGKSYICGNAIREAQKLGYTIMVFDSENAIDKDFLGRIGVNVEDVIHIPVITVTEMRNTIIKMMDEFMLQFPKEKLFIVIDSLGGLTTTKAYEDIEADKSAQDMGLRAKQLRDAAKLFTHAVAKHQACMLVTNHTYEKPPANPHMAPEIQFGGGEGFVYATSGIVYLKKSAIKEEVTSLIDNKTKKVKTGNTLKATSQKNRFVPEGMTGEIYLSYEKGMNKWFGLLEDALEFGFFTESSAGYYNVPHLNKKVSKKDVYLSENWVGMIDALAEKIREKYRYVPTTTMEEVEADMVDGSEAEKKEDD
jgi:RecA/RadA recombinase